MLPFAPIRRLVDNATAFAPLMKGWLHAAAYIVQSRGQPDHRCVMDYKNLSFESRRRDWPALREVLIDSEYALLRPLLSGLDSPVILDIGAHVGAFAIWTLAQRPNSQVHSLEASAATFQILKTNCLRNRQCRWHTYNWAAWRADEPVPFDNRFSSDGSRIQRGGGEIVDGVTLPTFLVRAGLNRVDVAKIDIEGAEEAFLSGQEDSLRRIDALVVELHPGRCNHQKVISTLENSFSHLSAIHNRTKKPLILATRRPPPSELPLSSLQI